MNTLTRSRNRYIRWLRPLLVIVTSLAVASPILAAAAEDESVPPAETRTSEASTEESGEGAAPDPASDVFIPTEEISEDFAVPFPVDI